jgi:ferredoxin
MNLGGGFASARIFLYASERFLSGMSNNVQTPYLKIEAACIACEWCKYNCPVENCITFETAIATIQHNLCIECNRCIYVCPIDVIIPLREAQHQERGDKRGKERIF